MKIAYEPNTMKAESEAIAYRAAEIAEQYNQQGYDLTLRQLYYQFVALGITADWATGANTERSYKRLGSIVDKARMCGIIDWYHITDRTRGAASNSHWNTPADIIRSAARGYAIDKWEGQPRRVELWVEKEALAGIVGQVAAQRDCTYTACRGYMSSSAMWRAARRLGWVLEEGQDVVVLHLGDHDPSGIDMTRDNFDRLRQMISHDFGHRAAGRMEFRRIALNMNQVEQYQPPPNPAKMTDSRANGYVDLYGYESWELDALPPDVLVALMNSHIDAEIDHGAFEALVIREEAERERLQLAAQNWADVAQYVDVNFNGGRPE